jgi:hypothetical protein
VPMAPLILNMLCSYTDPVDQLHLMMPSSTIQHAIVKTTQRVESNERLSPPAAKYLVSMVSKSDGLQLNDPHGGIMLSWRCAQLYRPNFQRRATRGVIGYVP